MVDIASLAIQIDTSDVARAENDLERLGTKGAKAEQAAKGVGDAYQQAAGKVGGVAGAADKAGEALEKLGQQADGAGKSAGAVGSAMQKAAAGLSGVSGAAGPAGAALSAQAQIMQRAGMSAAQYNQAMLMLPMQLTDVVTSLASGMPVWMTAIQQGGQVRDAFGGIGNAARAVAAAIPPAAAALTGIAAAAAVVAHGFAQGEAETTAFQRSIVLTGNAAGTTVDQLRGMSIALSASTGTQGEAAAALAAIAGAGKIAADQMLAVGESALAMSKATGRSIEETVKEFVKLAEEPAAASAKLNEQYNYLTASVYEQIRALEEQGRTTDATKLAADTYAAAMKERARQVVEDLGFIQRAWAGIIDVTKRATDSAKGFGRRETTADQIAEIEGKLSDAYTALATAYRESDKEAVRAYIDRLNRQKAALELSRQEQAIQARMESERAASERDRIAELQEQDLAAKALTNAYEAQLGAAQALGAEDRARNDLKKAGIELDSEQAQKILATARALDDLRASKAAEAALRQASQAAARQEEQAYRALYDSLFPAETAQRKYNEQVALLDKYLDGDQLAKAVQRLNESLYVGDATGPADAIEEYRKELEALEDKINPAGRAAKDFAAEQAKLRAEIERTGDPTGKWTQLLQENERQFEQSIRATSEWAQWTESALERVDSAFADAWRNIGDGFDGFRDSLTNAFRQMLAELAHMAITRPIVMQIGAALGIGGAAGQATAMMGGGSGGGIGVGSLLQYGHTAYSAITGVGPAALAGWQSGGLMGGIQGVGSYYGNMASGAYNAAAGWLGGGVQGGAGVMLDASGNLVNVAAQNTAATAGAYAPWASAAAGAYMGYQNAGAKGAVAGGLGGWGGAKAGAAVGSYFGPIGTAVGAVLGGILGSIGGSKIFGGDWQTKDVGLGLGVSGGDFAAQSFEYQKKKGGLFSSNKKRTIWSDLDAATAAALQETFDATEAGVASLFESLSLSVEEGSLAGLQLARKQISTKGKTEEEISQAIAEWFGSAAEAMNAELNRVFGTGLDYDLAGMQAFVGNLLSVNDAIRYLNVGLFEASVAGGKMAEELSALAGGFDALAQNTATYQSAFFTAAEQQANALDAVRRQFEDLDVALPATRAEFRRVVEALDLTTATGRKMFATMTSLAGSASAAYSALEAQLMGAVQSSFASVQRSVAAQRKAISDAFNARSASLNDMAATASASLSSMTGVANSLDAALKRLRGSSDDAVRMLRAQSVATLQSALSLSRSGQSLAGVSGLQDALDVASEMDAALYGSLEDFQREQGRTAGLIAELEKVNGKQLTTEEKLLKSVQDQLKAARQQYDADMAGLDAQLAYAQAQLDALNGIDNSVMELAGAMAAMGSSVVAALGALPKGAAQANTPANNRSIIDTIYQSVLGRSTAGDEAGAAFWSNALQTGQLGYDQIAQAIAKGAVGNAAESAATKKSAEQFLKGLGVPAFATGGVHAGGLRLVGENGPELEVTGPSRIYNASQTAAMLGGGSEAASEVRALRADLAGMTSALRSVAKHTMQTAKRVEFLERWDYDGLPTERATA